MALVINHKFGVVCEVCGLAIPLDEPCCLLPPERIVSLYDDDFKGAYYVPRCHLVCPAHAYE